MPTVALVILYGACLGPVELDEDEGEPGAVIRRPGQPDRRVLQLLEIPEEEGLVPGYDVLIVERVEP